MARCQMLLAVTVWCFGAASKTSAFVPFKPSSSRLLATTRSYVSSELEKETEVEPAATVAAPSILSRNTIPKTLRIEGKGIPNRNDRIQLLDTSTYEANLISSWDVDPERQKGFDWEIEKARRFFAGLRLREDGTWVKQPSFFDFLVSERRMSSLKDAGNSPKPVNILDVGVLMTTNVLTQLGFGPALGMAAIPEAVIQKYEGSMFSFIKGVLGGDLQTLAGGPLFLLLAKYFHDYGSIFNLSFGPKSFLVISDPVMARHILRETPSDQYCKGMLAEILVRRAFFFSCCAGVVGTYRLVTWKRTLCVYFFLFLYNIQLTKCIFPCFALRLFFRNQSWEKVSSRRIRLPGKSVVVRLFLHFTSVG